MGVDETVDMYVNRGVFKPPFWVLSWYYAEYLSWAKKFEPADDKKSASKYERDDTTGDFPWPTWLRVSPHVDLWCAVEESVYGEIVTTSYKKYKEELESRRS
jgi:hypothetical protein